MFRHYFQQCTLFVNLIAGTEASRLCSSTLATLSAVQSIENDIFSRLIVLEILNSATGTKHMAQQRAMPSRQRVNCKILRKDVDRLYNVSDLHVEYERHSVLDT